MTIRVSSLQQNPLDIGEMARFDETLDEYEESEKRRKRVIYLKSALQKINAGKSLLKSMGCLIIPFLLVPVFWPVLLILYVVLKSNHKQMRHQFKSALEYWDINISEVDEEMTMDWNNQ
ncbi:MAG: hypothetical protein JXR97_08960 [Planctomycetes bacterium]|nr:hypothetical protein [Planctomycetota bacterium]